MGTDIEGSARDDATLLAAAGRGDRGAFAALVERHQQPVCRFIQRYLGTADRDAVEDLAQDVFLIAWKAASTFEPRAKVTTWLLRVAANRCLNYRRGRALRRATSLEATDRAADLPAGSPSAEQQMDRGEQMVGVRAAVAALSPKQRVAIVLRHFHDLPYVEIAQVLGISVSAVESTLFRARQSLRAGLARATADESPQVSRDLRVEPS
ncbi:MAG: RNA polymerase sigma factor [bacterium]|nr:RNA polymerase sigma factor [bacterium]